MGEKQSPEEEVVVGGGWGLLVWVGRVAVASGWEWSCSSSTFESSRTKRREQSLLSPLVQLMKECCFSRFTLVPCNWEEHARARGGLTLSSTESLRLTVASAAPPPNNNSRSLMSLNSE